MKYARGHRDGKRETKLEKHDMCPTDEANTLRSNRFEIAQLMHYAFEHQQ